MSMSTKNEYRYLPVKAGGQTLGIPFASIKRVMKWAEMQATISDSLDHADGQAEEDTLMINLTRLLAESPTESKKLNVVLLKERVALIVDSVAPLRSVDPGSYYAMPAIFMTNRMVFGGIIRDQSMLILMIDPDLLVHIPNMAESN